MRQTPQLPVHRRGALGILAACVLAVAGWGCQQPAVCYYYGYAPPPCGGAAAPAAQPSTVIEPPATTLGGTSSSDVSAVAPNASGTHASPRVVISEPIGQRGLFSRWRPSQEREDVMATTSVEGAVDSTINR